ncbi:MAG: DNA topoisomerase II [Candidatus Omnitrophica bacterium]|nr:DNA topoisomerase II [Candidatus Omnitrophota bacterium]MBU1996149.1 DNA topoisomerase II [Candidatus Omnitrophota bacterium]MBU4333447.1 DNA topoisomerase II [Candidatus Omnitrophota bacterium]
MAKLREIYQCQKCKLLVEVVNDAPDSPECCGEARTCLEAKTAEKEGKEKHVPVIEETDCCINVKVGSVEHPMLEEHYIKFIEVLTADKVLRAELKPGQKPEADFCVKKEDVVEVREFCTTHGLWKA